MLTVMVVCKNWPHVFLVINEYNDFVDCRKLVFKYLRKYLNTI